MFCLGDLMWFLWISLGSLPVRLSKCIASRQNPRSLGIMRLQTTWMDRSLTWSLCLKFHGDTNDDLYDRITYYLLHFRSCQTHILLLPYNDNTLHIGFCRPMAFTCLYYFHIFSHLFTIIIHWIFTCIFAAVCTGGRARGQGPGLGPMKRTALSRLSIDESIEVATRGVPAQPGCSWSRKGWVSHETWRDTRRHAENFRETMGAFTMFTCIFFRFLQ